MTRVYPTIETMIARMKPLPPRHRIAHLRALIGQLPPGSIRGIELMALLRDEMILSCGNNGRAG